MLFLYDLISVLMFNILVKRYGLDILLETINNTGDFDRKKVLLVYPDVVSDKGWKYLVHFAFNQEYESLLCAL